MHLIGLINPVLCVCAMNKYSTREHGTPERIFYSAFSDPVSAQIKLYRDHIPRNTDLDMSLNIFPYFHRDVHFSPIKIL